MTETEWLACEDLPAMMAMGSLTERVHRLFTAACARLVWHYLDNEVSRAAIELSEKAADHPVHEEALDLASGGAEAEWEDLLEQPESDPRINAAHIASYGSSPGLTAELALDVGVATGEICVGGSKITAALFREVAGNPFRPVTLDPNWLACGDTVSKLAEAAYEERQLPSGHLDPARLAVLADALEEAGCTDADILGHLRSPGPHVRGCWALDLLLGKQ
jgi:hypothetical protein